MRKNTLLVLFILGFLLPFRSESAKEKPLAYQKCRMKCVTKHESCTRKAERKDDDKTDALYECDMQKRECLQKC